MQISPVIVGTLTGIALSAVNTIIGVILSNRTNGKSLKDTMAIVMGGMILRLFGMAVFVWIALAEWRLDQLSFSLSLMISFFFFLMIEGFFFHKKHEQNKQPIVKRKKTRFPDQDKRIFD